MKKVFAIVLLLTMVLSLVACGNASTPSSGGESAAASDETAAPTEAAKTKESLLLDAVPLMKDEVERIFDNAAYAASLKGNSYTFEGKVYAIELDYIDVALEYIKDESGKLFAFDYWNLSAHVYLPTEEIINIENNQKVSIVGTITDVERKTTPYPGGGTIEGTVIIMKEAFLNN